MVERQSGMDDRSEVSMADWLETECGGVSNEYFFLQSHSNFLALDGRQEGKNECVRERVDDWY